MKKEKLAAKTIAELNTLAKKRKIALPAGAGKAVLVKTLAKTGPATSPKAAKPVTKKTAKKAVKRAAGKTVAKKSSKAAKKKAGTRLQKKRLVTKKTTVKKSAAKKRPAAKEAAAKTLPLRAWQMPAGSEEPREGQERVSDAKFYTGMPERKPPMPYDTLPHEYGGERMALLARDPFMALCYWEIPQDRLEQERSRFGRDCKLCVRIYDVTGVQFNGTNAAAYYDQEVYERVGSWYFDFGRPTHSFCADLGLIAPDGRFVTLIRSNAVSMPRDGVSDVMDEEWMLVEEEFLKLYGIPGSTRGGRVHGGLSSPEAQEILRQRRLLEITSPGTFQRQKNAKKK